MVVFDTPLPPSIPDVLLKGSSAPTLFFSPIPPIPPPVDSRPTMDTTISSLIRVKNGAPPSSYTTATVVTSIGAMVIESLTIVSAIYLLIPLASQGQLSKLRGKLLIALVISDLLLGCVMGQPSISKPKSVGGADDGNYCLFPTLDSLSGAVSTAAFLAGYPLLANTATCVSVLPPAWPPRPSRLARL